MNKILLTLFFTLALAACGPFYSTEYRYQPPADDRGRACVAQCEASKTQCRVNADLRAENRELKCEAQARDDYERCLFNAKGEGGKNSCARRSCSESADTRTCETDHRVCFEACGGVVQSQQVCTFNCP